MSIRETTDIFKICPTCQVAWKSVSDFLADGSLVMIGYQVNFHKLESGLILFNHVCESTLSVKVVDFTGLFDGPVFTEHLTGTEECPGFCLHRNELRPCPAQCECAYVREIMQIIQDWPKRNAIIDDRGLISL
jgi:hypothetical protein